MNNLIKEKGKKGYITYKYNNKYIYSYYDPINEAKKFLHTIKKINKIVITCSGADYINLEVLNNNVELIISFEPIKFDQQINSDKIIRINTIENIEKILLSKNIHAKDVTLIIWQPLVELFPDIYIKPLKQLKDILLKTSVSSNTANVFGFLESKNFLINYFNHNEIKIAKIYNKKINNPAVIISSGVSLKDNINFIKKISNKSYTFALPSSLPFLFHNNINPDFVVAVDPGYATLFHLSKYKKNAFLLTHLGVNPSIFNIKNFYPIIFNYSSFLENLLFQNIDIITAPAEGSVFINLLRLLPQLGFSQVIVIGQDFGYKENRSHINEGFFEKDFLSWSNYYSPLENSVKNLEESSEKITLNIENKKITSSIPLKIYYDHFLKSNFSIDILLPDNCFNPINKKIKKINYDYVLDNYNDKQKVNELLILINFSQFNTKNENLLNLIKNFFKNVTENNITINQKNIAKNIFFDFNNKLQKDKILKLAKALN